MVSSALSQGNVCIEAVENRQLAFPSRSKILKPGFRVAEKRNPGNPGIFGF